MPKICCNKKAQLVKSTDQKKHLKLVLQIRDFQLVSQ